jgi:probable HAF family extracellular repeat protein
MTQRLSLIVGVGLTLVPRWCAGAPARSYTVTDLGAMAAHSLNNAGQVAGVAYGGLQQAALWTDGGMQDLGTLRGGYSIAQGLNGAGRMVGISDGHAFLWAEGQMTDLGTLGGTNSCAAGINDAGQIVGYAHTPGDVCTRAFLCSDGVLTDLGTLGGPNSCAEAINNAGQVVGWTSVGSDGAAIHAFLWAEGRMTDLGTLGGTNSYALGINAAGQVVGAADRLDGTFHAFVYQAGAMRDLGSLPGGLPSVALGINGSSQIVGYGEIGNGETHAFVWTEGTGLVDLNHQIDPAAGWELMRADGINEAGQVVGLGSHNGALRSFLLTPR